MGALGTAATAAGFVLLPFFGASAGAMAATGATNGQILTSFWAPLFTDVAGNPDLLGAVGKMGVGLMELGEAGIEVVGAGFSAGFGGESVLEAVGNSWAAPS